GGANIPRIARAMFPSGSVSLVIVAPLSHAVPSATCPILRENYREIESRLMSSLVQLMRCLMKADFARAMRGYASRPAKGECPKWVISLHNDPFASCLLCPRKRTFVGAGGMSEKCH